MSVPHESNITPPFPCRGRGEQELRGYGSRSSDHSDERRRRGTSTQPVPDRISRSGNDLHLVKYSMHTRVHLCTNRAPVLIVASVFSSHRQKTLCGSLVGLCDGRNSEPSAHLSHDLSTHIERAAGCPADFENSRNREKNSIHLQASLKRITHVLVCHVRGQSIQNAR